MNLTQKKCVPCEAGTPPLEDSKISELLKQVSGWTLKDGHLFKKIPMTQS